MFVLGLVFCFFLKKLNITDRIEAICPLAILFLPTARDNHYPEFGVFYSYACFCNAICVYPYTIYGIVSLTNKLQGKNGKSID